MGSKKDAKVSRGQWATSIGFVLAAAGAAVGLGNVWKFPYLTALHGGGTFLFAYVLMLLFLGIPVLVTEMVLGRRGKLDLGSIQNLLGSVLEIRGYVAFR